MSAEAARAFHSAVHQPLLVRPEVDLPHLVETDGLGHRLPSLFLGVELFYAGSTVSAPCVLHTKG